MTFSSLEDKVYRPDRVVEVPNTDLLSWVFGNEHLIDPSRPLYVDALNPRRTLNYAQSRTVVRKLIKGFRALGVERGTCVGLHTYNIYYPLLFLAIIGAGGIVVASNPGYKELELVNLLEKSGASLVITAPELLPVVHKVTQSLDIPDSNVLLFTEPQNSPHGFASWEELLDYGEEDWNRFDDETLANGTPACFVCTSGTTGLPKLASLSHKSWVAFNCTVEDPVPKPYEIKRLIFLPMFHTYTTPLSNLAPLRCGHAAYIMPRYSKRQMINAVETLGINELVLVPPMVVDLASLPTSETGFLKNINYAFCGGAPLHGSSIKKLCERMAPGACLAQVYGMTETGWITSSKWPEHDDSGSVGKLMPNTEAILVNDLGEVVHGPGSRGQIMVRGSRLMTRYVNNPKATAEAYLDGWLKTGDIGTIDEQGRLFVVDRQKDLIKVRGWQVSPAELEGVLRTHPKILDAAVVGVRNKDAEAPKALVIRGDDSLTAEEVKLYISSLLIGYKHLDGGVSFVDSIPISPSGKILRKLLTTN